MTDGVPARFGSAVRARRAELGITLDQLADASGVSTGSLSKIERGALNPSLSNALAIAAGLGSDLSELLEQTPEPVVQHEADAQQFIDPDTGVRRTLLAQPSARVRLIRYVIPSHTTTVDFAPHGANTAEIFHVTQGALRVLIDGREPIDLRAGDTVQTPGDRRHRLENPGDEPNCFFIVMAPTRGS
ncbi:helix-turn-helix domain-containing protein [Micropruina sp.]|uniref:helix-turn-helix domain-containing protein n=1 Tax=Actinomycetes TaxID=1760 RepID=UPI0039E6C225